MSNYDDTKAALADLKLTIENAGDVRLIQIDRFLSDLTAEFDRVETELNYMEDDALELEGYQEFGSIGEFEEALGEVDEKNDRIEELEAELEEAQGEDVVDEKDQLIERQRVAIAVMFRALSQVNSTAIEALNDKALAESLNGQA